MSILEFPIKLWDYFQILGILSIACWLTLLVFSIRYAAKEGILRVWFGVTTLAVLVLLAAIAFEKTWLMINLAWIVVVASSVIYAISRQWSPGYILLLIVAAWFLAFASSDAVYAIRRKPSPKEIEAAELQHQEAMQLTEEEAAAVEESEINLGSEATDTTANDPPDDVPEDRNSPATKDTAEEKDAGKEKDANATPEEDETIPYYKRRGKVERVASTKADGSKSDGGESDGGNSDKITASNYAATAEPVARELEEADFFRARRWDSFNLFLVRSLLLTTAAFIVIDYLRRFNRTFDRIFPLPVASRFVDSTFPKTHLVRLAQRDESVIRHFLERSVAKGETFIYFTESDPWECESLPRLPKALSRLWSLRKLCFKSNAEVPGSRFLLESVWFDRYCFTVVGEKTAGEVLSDMADFLRYRSISTASVRQSVNVVWDFDDSPSAEIMDDLTFLVRATNFKLLIVSTTAATGDDSDIFEEIVEIDENREIKLVPVASPPAV